MEKDKLLYRGKTEIKGTVVGEIADIVEIMLEDGCTMLLSKSDIQVVSAEQEVPVKRIDKKAKQSEV